MTNRIYVTLVRPLPPKEGVRDVAAAPAGHRRTAGRTAPPRDRDEPAAGLRRRGPRRHPAPQRVRRDPNRRDAWACGATQRGPRRGDRGGPQTALGTRLSAG